MWKFCRRGDEKDHIEIEVITAARGSDVCHLHECGHVRRIRKYNKKVWRICDECQRYLREETDRAFQARNEV